MKYKDEGVYKGEFNNDKKNGEGTFECATGDLYYVNLIKIKLIF